MNNIKPISLSLETKLKLSEKLDPSIIKIKPDKSKTKYISGSTCIAMLNSIFGYMWDFDIVEQWVEPGVPFFKENNQYFTALESMTVTTGENKKGTILEQGPTMWVKGVLSVYLQDEDSKEMIRISKTAFGSTAVTGNQANQANNGYKGAQTDALKKAASLFGIASELYRDPQEEEWFVSYFNRNLPITLTSEVKAKYKNQIDEINTLLVNFTDPIQACSYYTNKATGGMINDFEKVPLEKIGDMIDSIKKDLKIS